MTNSTETLTLTDFLLSRIADDEAAARAASPGGWQYGTVESVAGGSLYDESRMIGALHFEQPTDHDGSIVRHLLSAEADANGAHIARHNPTRVLAECAAKRAIVEEATGQHTSSAEGYDILRHLAAVYAEHPDYRNEWRP